MKIPEPNQSEPAASTAQHWSTHEHRWRSYCESLIYAAASLSNPDRAYLRQVELRRHVNSHIAAKAMSNGLALHGLLVEIAGPECTTGLQIARRAWGDDLGTGRERRQRQDTTLALCSAYLPTRPSVVAAEESRQRTKKTQQDRDAAADELAAQMAP
jgi:hypothetical protein